MQAIGGTWETIVNGAIPMLNCNKTHHKTPSTQEITDRFIAKLTTFPMK
ncbi:MAG: hypothetical protein KAU50_05850 [Candidatus Marinimicrobia bacterium]|nr:hypothetical protein [Candidatus Neomarinimicrobiota bacterium]